MAAKRSSVDISEAQVCAALGCLPLAALKKTGEFVNYKKTNMKLAPDWGAGAIYMGTINKLLEASEGKRVNQVSFFKLAKKWVYDEDIAIADDKVESGVYRLRAIINELGNHKAKTRKTLSEFMKKHSFVWNIVEKMLPEKKCKSKSKNGQQRASNIAEGYKFVRPLAQGVLDPTISKSFRIF